MVLSLHIIALSAEAELLPMLFGVESKSRSSSRVLVGYDVMMWSVVGCWMLNVE